MLKGSDLLLSELRIDIWGRSELRISSLFMVLLELQMNRLFFVGLFSISLAMFTGCPDRDDVAKKNTKPNGIRGMNDQETTDGISGKLEPPPELTIPASARK